MSGASNLTADVDIDIKGLLGSIARRKWTLGLLTIVSAALLFVLFSSMDERYSSNGSILLEQRESVFTRSLGENQQAGDGKIDADIVGTQVEILRSDDLSLEVIRQLNLVNDSEFKGSTKTSLISTFTNALQGTSKGNAQDSAKVLKPGEFVEPTAQEVEVLDEFMERLTIFAVPNSHVISLNFWAHRKELARDVVNLVSEKYLERNKSAKSVSTNEAANWLGPLIEDLQVKLAASEAEMEAFRANNDLFNGTNNTSLATQQLSDISSELSRVRSQRSSAEAKAASIRAALKNGASINTIPEVISSGFIQRLQERVAGIEAEITQLSTSLLPNHPSIKAAKSQLAGYKAQIRTAANNILKSLESDVNLRRSQETELVQSINRLKSEASRVSEKEVQLRQLERKVASNRDALARYQNQFIQANSRVSNDYNPVDAVINQRAKIAFEAYFPKVIPFTIAGSLSILLLSIIGLLAIELLSGRAFKPVAQAHVAPTAAAPTAPAATIAATTTATSISANNVQTEVTPEVMPQMHPNVATNVALPQEAQNIEATIDTAKVNARIAKVAKAAKPISPAELEAAVASLSKATNSVPPQQNIANNAPIVPAKSDLMVDQQSEQPIGVGLKVAEDAALALNKASIAVVSPGGDQGSNVVLHLARTLSSKNKKVIVLDLTGTSVTLANMVGDAYVPGLGEFLTGDADLSKVVLKDKSSTARILGAGNLTNETLSNNLDNLKRLADLFHDANDYVIFDCGPIGVNGLSKIANEETIVFIPTLGADTKTCLQLEQKLIQTGFEEAVVIDCSEEEIEELQYAVSA